MKSSRSESSAKPVSQPVEASVGEGDVSSARSESWRHALTVREPAAVYDVEADPAVRWSSNETLSEPEYSIRLPKPGGPAHCARCRVRFSAAGPTGFAEDQPVCDMCLLEGSSELGMVLALVAVVRAFATVQPTDRDDYREGLAELGAFARIYEGFAVKAGPPRVFHLPSFDA